MRPPFPRPTGHFGRPAFPCICFSNGLDIAAGRAYAVYVRFVFSLCLALAGGSYDLADFSYPQNAVGGGTVVAQIRVSAGAVTGVTLLSGEEPFAGSCKASLARWRLDPEEDGERLVVVHFRRPELYYAGERDEAISGAPWNGRLAYPRSLVPPVYPANALGKGSVVLQIDISDEGRVVEARAVKSMGILTDASVDAVRRWTFHPARDASGRPAASKAYAVIVFRYPTIAGP